MERRSTARSDMDVHVNLVSRLRPHGATAAATTRLFVAVALALTLLQLPECRGAAVTRATTNECDRAQDDSMACLNNASSRLRELAANDMEGRWFTNANGSDGLVSFFCSEYEKSSACLCHVHDKCSPNEVKEIMTRRAAHFGVYGELCRHRNLTGEFAKKARCYRKAKEVFHDCFLQCWANKTCASCSESMDCTEQILSASCQRDREFVGVLKLLIRVKESFMDANDCFADSSVPLHRTFLAYDRTLRCPSDPATHAHNTTTEASQRGSPGGLTSSGCGGRADAWLLSFVAAAVALTLGSGRRPPALA